MTECIIKNHIENGFAISYTDKMAGYFKMSKGTEFINVFFKYYPMGDMEKKK